jgi:tetratricopeptide (TPR) repeat protein
LSINRLRKIVYTLKIKSNISRATSIACISILLLVAIIACSTEKDAVVNRGFHNLTARYNGYFNAGEIINDALASYREKTKDDYTKIIDLEIYPNQEDAPGLFPQMDLAIEKCSKVIYKHAMPNPNLVSDKDKENCAWIDDNWLVIGQSHYVKREYTEAIQKFKYIKKAYNGQESTYAAKIWLAKTYIEQGLYSKAKIELDKAKLDMETADANKKTIKDLFSKKEKGKRPSKYKRKKARKEKKENKKTEPAKFSDKLKVDYEITFTNLYIHQKEYKKAIIHLEEAITLTKNKKNRARYMYVLAQLYQEMGDGSNAVYYYTKVSQSNAPYEMRFYAKINTALSSTSGSQEQRKDLSKMLKDNKNEEYKDQIYYVLAQLDLKEGGITAAKVNLTKSVFYSINNDRQKGISYLTLADLHFEEKDYISAQKYYDSCITALPKSYENYKSIESKAGGLSNLVTNYEVVERQDSLQKIAFMPEKDREKFLKTTLKQIKEDELRQKVEEEARLLALQERVNNTSVANGTGSKFYFYNQKELGKGVTEFKTSWGQRILEDDWRRSNKESISDFQDIESDTTKSEEEGLTVDILRLDLPLTSEAVDSSNIMILNALYNLGIIYKEELYEEAEALSYFTEVIDRGIKHPKVLPASYQLYLMYTKTESSKAKTYKDLILTDYPNSEIAKLVLDPDYLKKKEEKEREDLDAYSLALNDYRYRRYMKVITQCNTVIATNPQNKYINKYYLLKANSISESNIGGVALVEKTLKELYALAPDSEEGIVAKAYLDKMGKNTPLTPKNSNTTINYLSNKNEQHYFVLIFPNHKGDINPVKINIANFNSTYFKTNNLKLTNGIIGNNDQTVQVKSFVSETKAMIYYRAFGADIATSLLGNVAKEFQYFIITKTNYSLFYNNRDIDGYFKFFTANYN